MPILTHGTFRRNLICFPPAAGKSSSGDCSSSVKSSFPSSEWASSSDMADLNVRGGRAGAGHRFQDDSDPDDSDVPNYWPPHHVTSRPALFLASWSRPLVQIVVILVAYMNLNNSFYQFSVKLEGCELWLPVKSAEEHGRGRSNHRKKCILNRREKG